jgi:hypothetical protein
MALCLSARKFGACSAFQTSVKDLSLAESLRRLAPVHLGRQLPRYACGTKFKPGSRGFGSWSVAQTIRARKAVVQAVATGEVIDIEAEVGALFSVKAFGQFSVILCYVRWLSLTLRRRSRTKVENKVRH